jgi:AmmeMemoRadiSam system radical SAM enzyme
MHEAMLYERMTDKKVHCHLCGRRCLIPNGQLGYCHVRKNEEGTLYSLVYAKACAANPDPIEKKPLWHYHPGSLVMSIATIGCNFRCQFCFHPETTIVHDGIPQQIGHLFYEAEQTSGENIRIVRNSDTTSATGRKRRIGKVFCHEYEGELVRVKASYLPPFECTPEHEIFVWNGGITKKAAGAIQVGDSLVVPKLKFGKARSAVIRIAKVIGKENMRLKKPRRTDEKKLREILDLKEKGFSSKEIGKIVGMHPVYLRKLIGILHRDGITEETFYYENDAIEKEGLAKFRSEKNWVTARVLLNEELGELLGYYVAEGWISRNNNRPNSLKVNFSYGPKEEAMAERTSGLIKRIFDVDATTRKRRTTVTVEFSKSSLGALFAELCGNGAKGKKVPDLIFKSPRKVALSFLKAYISGDGTETGDNIVINTVSRQLAVGVYYLLLKLGYLPGFYEWKPPEKKDIEGRTVHQSMLYYVKVNAKTFGRELVGGRRKRTESRRGVAFRSAKDLWIVPVRRIERIEYAGPVYNMEVEGEHSYLANFAGVGNCQNWEISHETEIQGRTLLPEKVVELAEQAGCTGISYTYTEPTIFFEYAYDTAKLAHERGLFNTFVTNGYLTPEGVKTIAPYLDAATVDFKGSGDPKFYRQYCSVPSVEPIYACLKAMHTAGIHVEITNLVVTKVGDSAKGVERLAQWIVTELGSDTPLHLLRFYPHYEFSQMEPTPIAALEAAATAARKAGLKYVYLGNVPGHQGANTVCPNCGALLVERLGVQTLSVRLTREGRCPTCKLAIPIVLAKESKYD